MEIRQGTPDDYQAVADMWNSLIGVKDSIWQFAPTANAEHIAIKIDQGNVLYVAYEGSTLVGYGMWCANEMLGINAINRDVYWAIGKQWALLNPGTTGKVRCPNLIMNERTWLEDTGVSLIYTPEGYKPLKPGEDISTRKVWTYIVTFSLDELKAALVALGV